MATMLGRLFNDTSTSVKGKIVALYALLICLNIAVWIWAFIAFHAYPLQLSLALIAYSFGLRHAVDADHIAAIDNVTRKLMQEGKRPVGVGFFFSLGHSTIVILASLAVALAAAALKSHLGKDQLASLGGIGGIVGTLVSASFLLAIAIMNIFILVRVIETFRHVKAAGIRDAEDIGLLLSGGGFIARLCRPLFKIMTRSWQMYPLGFLFGLGFDTATEIGLIGISAASASRGMSVWSILVFPALFTAGMSLIDTTDGILMLGAYGWAFAKPIRKLFYNVTVTAVSVAVALGVGSIEVLGLIGDRLNLKGAFWIAIGNLNDHFGLIGFLIIGLFVGAWLVSFLIYRLKGYDDLERAARMPNGP